MTDFMPGLMAAMSLVAALVCYFGGRPVTGTYYLASCVLLVCVILQAKGIH